VYLPGRELGLRRLRGSVWCPRGARTVPYGVLRCRAVPCGVLWCFTALAAPYGPWSMGWPACRTVFVRSLLRTRHTVHPPLGRLRRAGVVCAAMCHTGLRLFTPGHGGLLCARPGYGGSRWARAGCNELHRAMVGYAGLGRAATGHAGIPQATPGCGGSHRAVAGRVELWRAAMCHAELWRVAAD
jgi:hypothetical protein